MQAQEWVVDPVTQIELRVPAWTTPGAVIERAARLRAGQVLVVTLFAEWTVTWPVWEVGGDPVESDVLGLSKELEHALLRWVSYREQWLDVESGWKADGHRDTWVREGHRLEDWLEREAWEVAEVRRTM